MTTNTAALSVAGDRDLWSAATVSLEDKENRHRAVSRKRPALVRDARIERADDNWIAAEPRSIVFRPSVFAELQGVARRCLGYRTAHRLKKFSSYESGWDGMDSKTVSPFSAGLLAGFLTAFQGFPSKPSVFLTRDGHFELSWEDAVGRPVSIVFQENACQVDMEGLRGEFPVFRPSHLQNIARSLNR